MTHFLIVFDRATGRLLLEQPMAQREDALRARFAAEREHRHDENVEVVVLTAGSADDLRRTHARYFSSVRELVTGPSTSRSALSA